MDFFANILEYSNLLDIMSEPEYISLLILPFVILDKITGVERKLKVGAFIFNDDGSNYKEFDKIIIRQLTLYFYKLGRLDYFKILKYFGLIAVAVVIGIELLSEGTFLISALSLVTYFSEYIGQSGFVIFLMKGFSALIVGLGVGVLSFLIIFILRINFVKDVSFSVVMAIIKTALALSICSFVIFFGTKFGFDIVRDFANLSPISGLAPLIFTTVFLIICVLIIGQITLVVIKFFFDILINVVGVGKYLPKDAPLRKIPFTTIGFLTITTFFLILFLVQFTALKLL
ncbi:MAG: hypothetical protein HRU29_11225 [Rhizobiales bacterium]|nr:hypothetical protein [Hyphomicrobiales bacterium]NRB14960.1 hypothetical protein [Hyphomicrobiales bacterium]